MSILKEAKLSLDESEQLSDLLSHDGFKVLVSKIMPALLVSIREKVLTYKLQDQDSLSELAFLRANYDGAKALVKDMQHLKQHLKSADAVENNK